MINAKSLLRIRNVNCKYYKPIANSEIALILNLNYEGWSWTAKIKIYKCYKYEQTIMTTNKQINRLDAATKERSFATKKNSLKSVWNIKTRRKNETKGFKKLRKVEKVNEYLLTISPPEKII